MSLAKHILEQFRAPDLDLHDAEDLSEEIITEMRAKKMVKFVIRQGKKLKLVRWTCPKRAGYIARADARHQCTYKLLAGKEKINRARATKRVAKKGTTKRNRNISYRRRSLMGIKSKRR